MQYQMRDYTVKPGEMADWQREWAAMIRPLREKFGFQIVGAWTIEEENRFIWILAHRGPGTFEEADAAYYAAPERAALDPNPVRHLSETRHWLMKPVG